jgi:hypothetical protein
MAAKSRHSPAFEQGRAISTSSPSLPSGAGPVGAGSPLILFSFSAAKFGCRIALMMICGYGRVLTDGSTGFQGLPSHGREQLN